MTHELVVGLLTTYSEENVLNIKTTDARFFFNGRNKFNFDLTNNVVMITDKEPNKLEQGLTPTSGYNVTAYSMTVLPFDDIESFEVAITEAKWKALQTNNLEKFI